MKNKKTAVVLGAGQGLGQTLCQQFFQEGYEVIGVNRSVAADEYTYCNMLQADLSDSSQSQQVLQQILETYGVPEVVVHNTAQLLIKPFLKTSQKEYELAWQSMSNSLFTSMQVLLPGMVENGKGTVIVSGATASIRGGANFSAFTSAKFALRGLTQSLSREFQSQGIHIAHVLLDGLIDTDRSREIHSTDPSKMMLPEDIAKQYLMLINQPKTTWTHELDLRPSSESF